MNQLPHEILISHISPYLFATDRNTFLSSCTSWKTCLLATRTICLFDTSWLRFCRHKEYRKCILGLVGCIDPVTKEEVAKRKLKVVLEYELPSGYMQVELMEMMISVLHTYHAFILDIECNERYEIQQILQKYETLYSFCKFVKIENIAFTHWSYCLSAFALQHPSTTHQHGQLSQQQYKITNLQEVTDHCLHLPATSTEDKKAKDGNEEMIRQSHENILQKVGYESVNIRNDQIQLVKLNPLTILHKVNLTQCHTICDLSALRGIPEVKLYRCNQVVDIAPLSRAILVMIILCPKIVDFTPLQSVSEVALWDLEQLQDVSCFHRVQTWRLQLDSCRNVQDISMLTDMRVLQISRCPRIQRYPQPSGIQKQAWNFVRQDICDLTGFERLYKCSFENCRKLVDVSSLSNMHSVGISQCNNLTDISPLANVKILTLIYCHGIRDVSMLGNVEVLNLKGCKNISSIEGLHNLHGKGVPEAFRSDRSKWFFFTIK